MVQRDQKSAQKVGLGVLVVVVLLTVVIALIYNKISHSSSQNSDTENQTSGIVASEDQSQNTSSWTDTEKINLAKYLTEKGVIFYGAYWCSHCKEQKELFGDEAMQYITYYECDPQGENSKAKECEAANIQGCPTWIYNGEKKEGTQTLDSLANWVGYNK